MRVYQNLGINPVEDANLPVGTIGLPYIITDVKLQPKAYGNKDVLNVVCKEQGAELGKRFSYPLIGEEVYNKFMDDIGSNNIEGLVSKQVLALVSPNDEVIRGLVIKH